MNNDFTTVNQFALEALAQNEFYKAQTLFRQNVKENPCLATFNNLGVFYIYEGLFQPDDSVKRAIKLGISYLKKAQIYQKSSLTLTAIGYAFFKLKDYNQASKNFKQACELKLNYANAYNLANSFYMQDMYKNSLEWFEKSLNMCENSEYIETYIAYSFSLLKVDKNKCRKKLKTLIKDDTAYMEMDKFVISYLCDDLKSAELQIENIFKHFSPDIEELAMIFDCLFKLNKHSQAEKFLNCKLERLEESSYNDQSEIKKIKRFFLQDNYRKKIISSFQFRTSLIEQCCYYGCKQHDLF